MYQNEKDLTVVPIYTYDDLRWFLQSVGLYKNGMTIEKNIGYRRTSRMYGE